MPDGSRAMTEVVLSLGSNIDREWMIPAAVRSISSHPGLRMVSVSRTFVSEPVDSPPGSPDFHNAAVKVETSLAPDELRTALRKIEAELGRTRDEGDPNAPRTIDIDISIYGNLEETFDGWKVPSEEISQFAHVAVPIADVAATWIHPETGASMKELVEQMEDNSAVVPIHRQLHAMGEGRYGVDFDAEEGEVFDPQLESTVRDMLVRLGEDPEREGLARTPLRVAKAMHFLTSGYDDELETVINSAIFDSEGAEEMVTVRDIEFYSLCEHHMLPFFGRAAVAYLPAGKIIGLSKVARIVDHFSRRLQVQERLTNQIADALLEIMEPHGTAVVLRGSHLCMMMRGVQKQGSEMVTSAMRGTFSKDARTRSEFLELIR